MKRVHKDEMIRFANSPEGTEVWFRNFSNDKNTWRLIRHASWNKDDGYIVNDANAELRKACINKIKGIK